MVHGLDSEFRLQDIFRQASGCRRTQVLTDEVLTEIGSTPLAQGDSRLQDLLVNDVELKTLEKCTTGELGKIIAQLSPESFEDQDGRDFKALNAFIAHRVISGILFEDEPLTLVKAGILAVVTKPGDPRIREIVANKLNIGELDWTAIAGLQF